MRPSLPNTILAGIAGTAVMTVVMYLAPSMGLPRMNAAEMLSGMTGAPVVVGWLMHVMIGVAFALLYSYVFLHVVRVQNVPLRGALFGVSVFVLAQVAMFMMRSMVAPMAATPGGTGAMILGSLIGHMMYGIPVALVARSTH